jgi:hypothetical protein
MSGFSSWEREVNVRTGFGTVAVWLALLLSGSAAAAQQTTPPAAGSDLAAITSPESSLPSGPISSVRIVRLSETTGEVEIDRNTGAGFETALLNLPIVEGCKLRTAAGFAEVEFEDGSTLRIAPFTTVEFEQLRLQPSGSTVSSVHVETGTVYASTARTKGNSFILSFASEKVHLQPSSHVRLFRQGQWTSVAALHGKVTVETPSGVTTVSKQTMNFHLLDPVQVSQNKNAAAPYDDWDQQAIEYQDHYAKAKAYGNPADIYGIADMNYYGSFVNVGGCGVLWQPYFTSPIWDPFANGSWVLYPSWGYAWVSLYPWGWTAYHYGQWQYCPSFGWGWQPYDRQFRIQPVVPNPPLGYRIPKPPPRPRPRESQIVTVNRTPAIKSQVSPTQALFLRGSAGLGVPRGNFSLSRLSRQAEQQGSAKADIWFAPMVVSNEHGSFAWTHSPGSIPDKAGAKTEGSTGTHLSYFGRPGSYSGGHPSSSYSSGGGYSGGHSTAGYSGGGSYSSSGGHSSGGGGGGGHVGR